MPIEICGPVNVEAAGQDGLPAVKRKGGRWTVPYFTSWHPSL